MSKNHIALAALLALAACGSPTEKTTNSGNTNSVNPNSTPNFVSNSSINSGSASDIERRLWSEVCKAAFNCPSVEPQLLLIVGRFRNQQECAATGDFPGLDLDNAQLQASLDAGRARWDEQKANMCFTEIQAELCAGGGFENVPSCDAVITGLVGEGGACATDEECADGLECATDGENCAGTCQPNCGAEQCTGDEVCDFRTEACKQPGGIGDACDWDPDCEDRLFCDDGGTCSAGGTVPSGGACSSRQECADGLNCLNDLCSSVDILEQGAACSFGEGEITAICRAGTVCTNLQIDGTRAVGTCSAPQNEGGACRVSFECAWGLACSSATPLEVGSCVPTLAAGGACADDQQCQSFNCFDGVCADPAEDEVCAL